MVESAEPDCAIFCPNLKGDKQIKKFVSDCNKGRVYNCDNLIDELTATVDFQTDRHNAQRKAALLSGLRATQTGFVALSVWGIVTGVAMVKSGLTEKAAVAMTLLVYGGSAQLTSLPLIAAGAPLWLIFAIGCIVNLRFLIFGAALHPFFHQMSWIKRLFLGYLTVDICFVAFMSTFADSREIGSSEQRWFYFASAAVSWLLWQITSLIGIALGTLVPSSWSLEFSATLALLAMVLPMVKTKPLVVSVLCAGTVAWVGQPLPLKLGLLFAVLAGIAGGMWAESASVKGDPT